MAGRAQIADGLQLSITACCRHIPEGSSKILQAMQDAIVVSNSGDGEVRVAVLHCVRDTHRKRIFRDDSVTAVTLHGRANTPTFARAEIPRVTL